MELGGVGIHSGRPPAFVKGRLDKSTVEGEQALLASQGS
jgi:hypothetical protein